MAATGASRRCNRARVAAGGAGNGGGGRDTPTNERTRREPARNPIN